MNRTALRSGSVFTGSGMLDCAVNEVLGSESAWFAEIDPDASKVLTAHWPAVPNLGDITAVDWSTVEPVDVLTSGFPCQDVSSAGKRVGMRPENRSGLWSHAAYAISRLHPRLVVIENVRGLLSADAHCDMEPCPWCLGSKRGRPLRALGAVLGDLAGLGYDTQWCGIRASDIGAPHGRFRVFIVARPAGVDPAAFRRGPTRGDDGVWAAGPVAFAAADTQGVGPVRERRTRRRGPGSADHDRPVADPASPRRGSLQPEHVRHDGGEADGAGETEPRRCGGAAADADGERWERSGSAGSARSREGQPAHSDRPVTADPESVGWREGRTEPAGQLGGPDVAQCGDEADGLHSQRSWVSVDGVDYGPAIYRWETIFGRRAPDPTLIGKRGGRQLSPAFVEWMQGWPRGWVTDVPGLSRNAKLKIAGNGVVPQQAAVAVALLTDVWESTE
jgi:DNA (cytosine-5)-methyltransferase 1